MRGLFAAVLEAERGQWPLWIPVLFGTGIALYFAPVAEPPWWVVPLAGLPVLLAFRGGRVPGLALLCVLSGFAAAQIRAHAVTAPVIAAPVSVTVEGRLREVSRSATGAPRLVIDRLVLHGETLAEVPRMVRVTVSKLDIDQIFVPGTQVLVHARLGPPGEPVEPGGFDFRRQAWFDRLGGIGYAEGPVLRLGAARAEGLRERIVIALNAWRSRTAEALRAELPGGVGSFAAAILIGDQSGIPADQMADLRASNLAHILSISGLHMGLLCGILFFGVRGIAALIPRVVLYWPVRRVAAVLAMLGGIAYLLLSGSSVAAERSCIMVVIVFGAMLIDRQALSLRGVATAAMLILIFQPESLMEVGFQMSFAATVALIATFDWLSRTKSVLMGRSIPAQLGLAAVTSLVAGLATAPLSAFVFHQSARYGLVANLLAVPVVSFWIMPLGILAAPAALIGVEGPVLALMGKGIEVVLAIAAMVADWPGALRRVPDAGAPVLIPILLGGLWLCLWQGRVRLAGLAGIAAGFVWWAVAVDRPALLIAASGLQVGLLGPEGRVILTPKREGFVTREWLAADGDAPDAEAAAARPGLTRGKDWARGQVGDWRIEVVTAKKPAGDRLTGLCAQKVLLIAPAARSVPAGPCIFVNADSLRDSGALAVRVEGGGLVTRAARAGRESRLWTRNTAFADID